MTTSQLGIYNIALAALGERSLDSLSEDGEPLRELNQAWSRDKGLVRWALEQGHWKFALRSQQIDYDTSVSPGFGYSYSFEIPDDMVVLNMISASERFQPPLLDYEEENGRWWADITPLYVRFVSDDDSYGGDMSLWTSGFSLWLGHALAMIIAPRYATAANMAKLEQKTARLFADAKGKDAMRGPVRFPPLGSWARSRGGYGSRYRERGRKDTLTGE